MREPQACMIQLQPSPRPRLKATLLVILALAPACYIGGAICTHWRVGDPFFIQILLGMFVWLGLYLREDRLKALIPLRRPR